MTYESPLRAASYRYESMPELPEVETIRRQLAPHLEGRTLERFEILDPRWTRPVAPAEVADQLSGHRVRPSGGAANISSGSSRTRRSCSLICG